MRLLTVDEVSDVLRVHRGRIYELARAGALPVVRLGRQIRVSGEALERWIEQGGYALPGGWRRGPAQAGEIHQQAGRATHI